MTWRDDEIRQAALEQQRRQQEHAARAAEQQRRYAEEAQAAGGAAADHLFRPGVGIFWLITEQEKQRQIQEAEESALRSSRGAAAAADEAFRRQQELAGPAPSVAVGHERLMAVEERAGDGTTAGLPATDVLAAFERISDHSHGRLNRTFMDKMNRLIAGLAGHPLEKLLGNDGTWLSRRPDADVPTVQAGHLVSRHGGREERFALEDSTYNQVSSNNGETQGAIFVKDAVDIGGVPVERRTALMWEETGILPAGTVATAPPHPGWTRERIVRNGADG